MKIILFGNKYIGYKPITESIRDFAVFCSVKYLRQDLVDWKENAAHGDRFVFDYDDENRELLCVE